MAMSQPPVSPMAKSTSLLVLLASLSALGQFASNVYLPSLPAVSSELGIDGTSVALTYTAYLAAFAIAQLFYGPLADRLGRRPLVLAGMALFIAGSAVCASAVDFRSLMVGRLVQAIGAAAGVVIARAMVRDVYSGPELARALALMTIIFAIAPGFSPLLGGLLQDAIGWRAVFGAALLVGIILFASALVFAPETLHKRSDPISLASVTHAYGQLLRDKEFMSFSLATAFIIGAMSAFFVGSPTVFIERLGVSATEYGFYPPLAITGFIIGGLVTRRLTERLDVHSLAKAGVFVSLIGAFLMVCFPSIGIQHKHAINVSIIIFVSGMGIFMPTAVALALERFSDRAASASAILGFLQMSVGAVTSAITGFLATQVPYLAFPSVMLVSALFAAALISTQTHPRSLPFGQ